MALKKSLQLANNFGEVSTFQNCYIKVIDVVGTKNNIMSKVGFFKEKAGLLLQEKTYDVIPDMDGANFIKQAYDHFKTLPEFSGAEDC
jgi:hypothetical protein